MKGSEDASLLFHRALDKSRLGRRHDTLESYIASVGLGQQFHKQTPKEFSLVIILSRDQSSDNSANSSSLSILIGKKLRGFGADFYTGFGGKLENDLGELTHPSKGACREVEEETGISIPLKTMEESFVGTINFTFEDKDKHKAMKVHLFCVFVSAQKDNNNANIVHIDPEQITGCDEIEPIWIHNVYELPLDQMFADDSVWLCMLLHFYESNTEASKIIQFNAYFHFHKGGIDVNSLMHYYLQTDIQDIPSNSHLVEQSVVKKYSLEQRLFHALHVNHIHNPSIKEFREAWSFANNVRSFMKEGKRMKYVLDVAGGHGALGAILLILVPECQSATVIDPAIVKGKYGVAHAWSQFWGDKRLSYRHECLRTGMRRELDWILNNETTSPAQVMVVACHACQHLTDETLEIASEYGVNVAVMPCCQKDLNGSWKKLSKLLANRNETTHSFGTIMDLLSAGKMMAWHTGLNAGVEYVVKMKLIDSSISPHHNRMIMCKASARNDSRSCNNVKRELAHKRLERAYHRAHNVGKGDNASQRRGWTNGFCTGIAIGVCIGSIVVLRSQHRI